MTESEIVRFADVSKTFNARGREVTALQNLDLSIRRGEIFAIIGRSGAGKSTLVRLINGLEKASSGSIVVGGTDITHYGEGKLAEVRQGIGMIFQQFNLARSRTVFRNVEFPLIAARRPKEERKERVWELLDFVGLTQKAWSYPEQLSGGQKQRVGIARALADAPPILLADEATSALDPETTQDVLALLKRVNADLGVTVVVITHEMDVVRAIADRVAVLDHGRIVELGSVYDVFSSPREEVTRSFLSHVLRSTPTAEAVKELRRPGSGRLVTATIEPHNALGEALGDLRALGVEFRLAYGAIDRIQHRELGSLTLELTGADQAVDLAIARLSEAARIEVIAS